MSDHLVYDKVWIRRFGTPVEVIVYSRTRKINYFRTGVDTYYTLITSLRPDAEIIETNEIFDCKEDALEGQHNA